MSPPDHSPLKLLGVRVLDLTTVMAGPYASALLGDLGAEVIKVEPPGGDITRRIGAARHEGMTGVWVGAFKRAGIPCEKVASTADLLQCEPLYEAGILHRVQHPTEGAVTVVGSPIRYGGATSPAPAPAPGLGQHTRAVLAEIGYTDEQIGRLTP